MTSITIKDKNIGKLKKKAYPKEMSNVSCHENHVVSVTCYTLEKHFTNSQIVIRE